MRIVGGPSVSIGRVEVCMSKGGAHFVNRWDNTMLQSCADKLGFLVSVHQLIDNGIRTCVMREFTTTELLHKHIVLSLYILPTFLFKTSSLKN